MGSHELSIDFNQALLLLEMSITIDESTWGNIPGDDTSMCVIFIAVFQLMGFYRVLVAICLQKKNKANEKRMPVGTLVGTWQYARLFSSALR